MSYFMDLLHGRRKVLHQLRDGLVQVVQVFLLILAGAQGLGCPLGPHQLFVRRAVHVDTLDALVRRVDATVREAVGTAQSARESLFFMVRQSPL